MHSNANFMKKRILLKDSQNNELYPRPCLPVGSLIFLNNTLDPNTYFMGKWEKIEEEVFFMTSSDDFPVGQVSGSNTHKLTIDEMPFHKDGFATYNGAGTMNDGIQGTKGNGQWNNDISTRGVGGDKPFDVRPRRYTINAWVRVS